MTTQVIERQTAAEGLWEEIVEEVVLDEVSAWRQVALRLASELKISGEKITQTVLALRELAETPMPANVRSHQRNRIFAAMRGQRPVSGGRHRSTRAAEVMPTGDRDSPPIAAERQARELVPLLRAAGPEAWWGAPLTRAPRVVSRVRELREAAGMTQTEVGDVVGVLPPTVSQWENGHHIPRVSTQRRLAELYGVTTADLHLEAPPLATSHQGIRVRATGRPNGYRYAKENP